MAQNLVIIGTFAANDPEKATLPFMMGNAALAKDIDVLVGLQSDGVTLAQKGVAETIHAEGFPPLKEALDAFLAAGGRLGVCGTCIRARGIAPDELIAGPFVGDTAGFVDATMHADQVLMY
jgi:predicted peroxiredoxin